MERVPWLAAVMSRRAVLLCGAILCVMAVNLIGALMRKSITNDETVLIPAAYYHLAAGKFDLVYEHPPLCKILAGIPLLFIRPNEARPEQIASAQTADERASAYEMTFWTNNLDKFERISFWARVPMIGLTLGLGVIVFAFGRELFGDRAAVFAVALFSLEPTVLAHGRAVQTDIPAMFGFLLLFYTVYRYAAEPKLLRAMWIGVAAGLALLAKFSMLLAGPILLVFFAVHLWRSRDRQAVFGHILLLSLTTLFIVNAAYYFNHRELEAAEMTRLQESLGSAAALAVPVTKALSHVVPIEFLLGVLWQVAHSSEGHNAGLLGMHSKTGWWYYFPVAFAFKTTLPFLLLSAASLVWGARQAALQRDSRVLWLLLPFVVYSALLLFTGINIGVRYYLPAYAFLFILAGGLLAQLAGLRRFRLAGIAVAALSLGSCAVIAARVYPDYMPYMNALASKRPHWWYLSDSNVEWGDDVKTLANYLHARGARSVRAALLGGFITLPLYGIDYIDASSDEPLPQTRYVALGASYLNGSTVPESANRTEEQRVNRFEAFRHRAPETVIGGSIYVFRMRD